MLGLPRPTIRSGGPARNSNPSDGNSQQIHDLNKSLHNLVTIFPDVQVEVLREALQAFDGSSRLHIAVDQLLKNQDKWVRGRWRRRNERGTPRKVDDASSASEQNALVNTEDEFRRASYKWAVYATLCREFTTVNKTAIKAVLAEENHCYTTSREKLRGLAVKSWKNALASLWTRWRKTPEQKQHFMIRWSPKTADSEFQTPTLKETGDVELDQELHQTVLGPLLADIQTKQEEEDREVAHNLNEKQAQAANALYECQCCFGEATFERTTSCTSGSHFVCHQCVCRTVSESIFGQGWARNVDHTVGVLRCPSISSDEPCHGHIPQYAVQHFLEQEKGGTKTWEQWNTRLSAESLVLSHLRLVKCPYCPYAEVDNVYVPATKIKYRLNISHPKKTFTILFITLNLFPFFFLSVLFCHIFIIVFSGASLLSPKSTISRSLSRLVRRRHRPRRLQCRSPSCGLQSCLTCNQMWRDPHICFESAALSLRAAVESARTAALKRTCPCCNLAFIKDRGCNKLTCVCGYSMCYVCRQGLGKAGALGEAATGEGYRHFCQHFRPMGGQCQECDKCDLYKAVDDDELVLHAGIRAEKEWREREGMVGVEGFGDTAGAGADYLTGGSAREKRVVAAAVAADAAGKRGGSSSRTTFQGWSLQAWSDWWVETLITC